MMPNLKTLIESDKLIIEDFDTISELSTFVAGRSSYEARRSANDRFSYEPCCLCLDDHPKVF
jgi:hypothetical protein